MDAVRYYLAAFLMIGVPSVVVYWLVIHPLVRFWRKAGPGWAYATAMGSMAATMAGLFVVRKSFLCIEFGVSYPLIGLAVVCMAGAAVLFVRLKKHLTLRIQTGWQELAPDGTPGTLLTDGIYARIRHPRYVELVLVLVAYALVANYLAGYVVVALCVPGLYLVTVLEEKELRDRFGEAYNAYCRRVPRFVPRRRGDPTPQPTADDDHVGGTG